VIATVMVTAIVTDVVPNIVMEKDGRPMKFISLTPQGRTIKIPGTM
jgi:hypothetical protein